ncbi:GxxExxY protein [Epilithonimonas zeae]|uniref:GxxExxY protein n=1 Tax=Epilithonimonas zeae TaxID=1416779 RepID=A0A1N6GBW5_9FLAO|nr:GxxExxY protein [Epilithonimonas zeae]SIO04977.1 GxxExxY protein [Epilithonimonas zeae]
MDENELAKIVVDLGFKVYKKLGAGLFENVYEECLFHDIKKFGLKVEKQKSLSIIYDDLIIENAFKIDLLVEDKLILEIKTVDYLNDVHKAQILTYLKMTNYKLGLLMNFRTDYYKNGIKRVVNKL